MTNKLPTYCINLKRRTDRKADISQMFIKHRQFLDIKFVNAIDGRDLTYHPHALGTNNKYACLRSHIKALEKIKFDGCEIALVCEDDIVLCDDFYYRFDSMYGKTPIDWNMLYLGCFDTKTIPPAKVNGTEIVKLEKHQVGAFAYIVNKWSIDRLIAILKAEKTFTDNAYADAREGENSINAYCFYPFMCYVKSDYSDTSEAIVNYDDYIKKHFENILF